MIDLARALEERGIRLKRYQPGEHRAPCPECDRGPRDDALAVKIEGDGSATCWFCHRCDWRGGIAGEDCQADRRRETRVHQPAPPPDLGKHETLAPWGLRIWGQTLPIERGTVAATYLERRGCALPHPLGQLRWHRSLKHRSGHVGPALVGLVTDVETGEAISLHRTWIAQDGSGKAEIDKPRLLLARHRSDGVIRLWPDEEVTLGLVLGEGVETALAAARGSLTPVWATMSASNLAALSVLPGIEGITILVDHDKPNQKTGERAGIAAAHELIGRYAGGGFDPERDIRVILPPTEGEDAADLVRRAA
jgi:putative DNA primase/helicase